MLYGLMTEEINFSYEGGIYGELIRNRSFKADAVVPRVTPDTYEAGKYLPSPSNPTPSPDSGLLSAAPRWYSTRTTL